MKIKATIEYNVDPEDYDNLEEILSQEQCQIIVALGYLWALHPVCRSRGTNVNVKIEEIL